jgi:hypothetical protein
MKLAPLLAALALAGCATGLPPVIPAPSIAQIAADATAIDGSGLAPGDLADIGYYENLTACDGYFIAAGQLNGEFGVAAQGSALGTGVAAALMAGRGAPVPQVAAASVIGSALAAGFGLAQNSIGIPYSPAVAEKTREAMIAYMTGAPVPQTDAQAILLVEGQRWLCTPPAITWLAGTAISSAAIGTMGPATSAAFATGPRGFAPVVITVNGQH